jgi:alanyl-tRNA synthetase
MATEKLYWDDPFALTFNTAGAALSAWEGHASIVLPATRFYPEAGGQLGDTGTLHLGGSPVNVLDTQITDDGVIHHLVAEVPHAEALAEPVRGEVDHDRRVDHMAHHTAQHMISSAVAEIAHADTVSARLGRASCTIDLDVPGLGDRTLGEAEDLVNAVIRDDVPIRAFFPTPAELAGLRLRRAPKVLEGIRVVDIEGFDQSPCGGTHCTRTGQLGLVRIAGVEKYKGRVRVTFHAAGRALADARAKDAVLTALLAELTSGPEGAVSAVTKLRTELRAARDALGQTRAELATRLADEALAANPPRSDGGEVHIVVTRERDDVGTLRILAGRLTSRHDVVAICLAADGDTDLAVVVQRGKGSRFDCGAWLKRLATEHGGRGGGRPERAEGRLPRVVLEDGTLAPHLSRP